MTTLDAAAAWGAPRRAASVLNCCCCGGGPTLTSSICMTSTWRDGGLDSLTCARARTQCASRTPTITSPLGGANGALCEPSTAVSEKTTGRRWLALREISVGSSRDAEKAQAPRAGLSPTPERVWARLAPGLPSLRCVARSPSGTLRCSSCRTGSHMAIGP